MNQKKVDERVLFKVAGPFKFNYKKARAGWIVSRV